jgi:hypothetical protein
MKVNFISMHLVKKIQEQVEQKSKILSTNRFIYFDEVIDDRKKKIDRVDRYNPYAKEEVLPLSWYLLSPKTLVKIYENLKTNKFYSYRLIDSKSHKVRIKRQS